MRGNTRLSLLASISVLPVLLFVAACSKSEPAADAKAQQDNALHTERLPRVAGAKEIYASAPTTIFTTTGSVMQTTDLVDKALVADGWQQYGSPFATTAANENQQIQSFKKGHFGLGILITTAPAQGNAGQPGAAANNGTNVQYNAAALKSDLPFPKDASAIAYDPERPFLTLVSTAPLGQTLDFYRQELRPLGWSLWSQKVNGVAPDGGASGELTRSGAYAYYLTDDQHFAVLTLKTADSGRVEVKFETLSADYLAALQREYFNTDTLGTPPLDASTLPRLDGATVDASRSGADRLEYSVAGAVPDTIAAVRKLLAADGWQSYTAPFEKPNDISVDFKKGPHGLHVFFTMANGRADRSGVDYTTERLSFALAVPSDATDIVFDANRPYLGCVTAQAPDAALDFYRKALAANGWSPLDLSEAAKTWPSAQADAPNGDGVRTYFSRRGQHPIVLTLGRLADNRTAVEIKVPPFVEPQQLEAGDDIYDLPVPKLHKSAGGTRGEREAIVTATVPAEVSTVLAFYRKELGARNFTEQAQGAVVHADDATLNFTTTDGSAVLKLTHKYDLTSVNLTLNIAKPAAKPERPNVSVSDALNQAQQMIEEANAAAGRLGGANAKPSPAPSGPEPALQARGDNAAPLPVPDTAGDVDFDSTGGRLEFDSTSSVRAVADFYRAVMKQQGWTLEPTVINNANMVSLDFNKAKKSVSITIMRMGDKTNVSADGSALKVARSDTANTAKAEARSDASAKVEVQASVQASIQASPQSGNDDASEEADVSESNGLPVPKSHTMSTGTKTPFRSELKASVPQPLADVLGLYRRELGKRGWKEETAGASITADSAAINFTAPDGPALLKLNRNGNATDVSLVVRNPDATAKAGLMPKPGQVKVMFGNAGPTAETITFNNQPIKVAAGAGKKGPDGPSLDLPPGTYKYSIKFAGQPVQTEEIELAADETWGLMILPGGVLPMQAY